MVHTQFIWSHGGNQVFLCGDFTGWNKYQQMVPVEGSLTTFMTICDLPPGLHKFKFLVDGVWRINEQQMYSEDEYGVSNIILVKQPEIMPHTLIVDDGLPIMDIDSLDDHNHVVNASTSSNIPREPLLPLNSEEIETTRSRLSQHLSSYTVYDLIPESGKVFALDANVSVEEAFLVMHEEGLAVAPLWDESSRQISGMLTATDFILILMEQLQRNHALVANNVLELSSISSWKEGKLQLQKKPLIKVDPDETLNTVAIKILQNHISTVPVLYSTPDTIFPQVLHIACLSGLLNHINKHFEHRIGYLPVLQQPIGRLQLGSWIRDIGGSRELLTLLTHQLLSDAFILLLDEHISSVPIVDSNGALVNIFSRSDITSLAKGNVYAHIQLDRATISQALQLVDKKAHSRFGICTRFDTLYHVITLLSDPGVRRVVVVEAGTQRVLGLITLRDVFSLIFRDFR